MQWLKCNRMPGNAVPLFRFMAQSVLPPRTVTMQRRIQGVGLLGSDEPPPSGRVWWLKTLELHGCIKVDQQRDIFTEIVPQLYTTMTKFGMRGCVVNACVKFYQKGFPSCEGTKNGGLPLTLTVALTTCLLYTSPSPRDRQKSRMPSSA